MHLKDREILENLEKYCTEKTNDTFTIAEVEEQKLKPLLAKIKIKWKESHRVIQHFLKKNEDWLNTEVTITVSTVNI